MNFSRMDLADCVTPEALLTEISKLQGGAFPIPVPIDTSMRRQGRTLRVPDFFASDADALADLRRCAAEQG